MKISMILKIGTIAATGFLIAACSNYNTKKSPNTNTAMTNQDGAASYATNNSAGYNTVASSRSANRMRVNSLKAPSNQTYYFSYDSNTLHSSDVRALTIQANYLASHPHARIRLEGNTDNRGSREYNVALGWRRDQSVERFLQERGVAPKQIQMVSYGKEHPAVVGNTQEDWALNRRVNLIYKAS